MMRMITAMAFVLFSQGACGSDGQEAGDEKLLSSSPPLEENQPESEDPRGSGANSFKKTLDDLAEQGQRNGNANGEDDFVKKAAFFGKAAAKAKKVKKETVKHNNPFKAKDRVKDVKERDVKDSFPSLLDHLEEELSSNPGQRRDEERFISQARFYGEAGRMAEEDDWDDVSEDE